MSGAGTLGIKVTDIAFVRFSAPDLDRMKPSSRTSVWWSTSAIGDVLYARGSDPDPWIHSPSRVPPGFRGVAFDAASEPRSRDGRQDRGRLGRRGDRRPRRRPSRALDRSGRLRGGGGARPRAAARAARARRHCRINRGSERRRLGTCCSGCRRGPPRSSASATRCYGWATSGTQRGLVRVALRLPRRRTRSASTRTVNASRPSCAAIGDRSTGPPLVPVRRHRRPGLRPRCLRGRGLRRRDVRPRPPRDRGLATTTTGVGRHVLGAQVFDYWRDPWGHVLEHFTDGDLLTRRATRAAQPRRRPRHPVGPLRVSAPRGPGPSAV